MPGVGGAGGPSLSEIRAWDVTHLQNASKDWTATAEHWESSFASIHRVSVSPGGTVWEGAAAEAAQERAFADLVKVRGLADVLHESAAIARRGADTLDAAKRGVLDAVEEANSAGYAVGEDLSVTPRRGGMAAQAQAQVYAADIRQRAAQLIAHDKEIAAKIATATAPLNQVTFHEPGDTTPPAQDHKPKIQAVDRTWKQGPDQPAPPGDPGTNPRFPGRDPQGRFTGGNTGSADGAAAAEKALQDFEHDNNTQLIRQQIRVSLIDPKTGQPIYRYYDALEPVPGHPGEYIGIEVKSGTASLSPNQRIFDPQVSPQNPATGTLNGQPVKVINTEQLRAPQFVPETPPGATEPVPARVPEPAAPRPIEPPAAPLRPSSGGFGGGGGGGMGGGGGGTPGLGIGGLHVPSEEAD